MSAPSPRDWPVCWDNPTLPYPFTGLGGPNPLATGVYDLIGWDLIENTGGGPSIIIIRDGWDTTGVSLGLIRLNASESVRDSFAPAGIRLVRGAFTHQFLGVTDGCLYLRSAISPAARKRSGNVGE